MLTPKQHELLIYIDRHLRETGFSPSFEEMKGALHLRSKSGIHRLILALEEREFLKRHRNRARALEVIRMPQDVANRMRPPSPQVASAVGSFEPNVIEGNFKGRFTGARVSKQVAAVRLPLLGRIAAGVPIDVTLDNTEVEVPTSLLSNGDHFALEVAGDSMIDLGILDGDLALIRTGETAETGQIVVALIDENEVTLKRYRRRGASIALEPANPRYETRIFPETRVKLQGRMVALLRRL